MFSIDLNKFVKFCEEAERNNTESAWYAQVCEHGNNFGASVKFGDALIEYDSISDERGIFYERLAISDPHYYHYQGGKRIWKIFECDEKAGDTNSVEEDFADFLAEEMIMNPSKIRRETCHAIAVLFKAERD